MTLFLPVACPGSGKSTLAAHMVNNDFIAEDAVVSPDRYREILTGDRQNQKCNKTVFEIVDRIVDSRILHGLDVYLDGTNLNTKLRNRLLNRVTALSYDFSLEIVILVSDAPRSLVERRNLDRQFPVPQDVFDRFWKEAEAFDGNKYKAYGVRVLTFSAMYEEMYGVPDYEIYKEELME